jgi:predicted O-methyltransferase YrrM
LARSPIERGKHTILRALTVLTRVGRSPSLLNEVGHKLLGRVEDNRHQRHSRSYADRSRPITAALETLLGVNVSEVEACLAAPTLIALMEELERYQVPRPAQKMGGAAYLELSYAIVRLIRPAEVIETGVALGYSTAAILQALDDNETGQLSSVDLPVFAPGTTDYTADAVPKRLRDSVRWKLFLGPDRRVLPITVRRVGQIDVLFYDSDKSYRGMRSTWALVWPHLRPGGILVADDIHTHDAFLDFSDEVGLEPVIVAKPKEHGVYRWSKTYYVGLLKKPPIPDGKETILRGSAQPVEDPAPEGRRPDPRLSSAVGDGALHQLLDASDSLVQVVGGDPEARASREKAGEHG